MAWHLYWRSVTEWSKRRVIWIFTRTEDLLSPAAATALKISVVAVTGDLYPFSANCLCPRANQSLTNVPAMPLSKRWTFSWIEFPVISTTTKIKYSVFRVGAPRVVTTIQTAPEWEWQQIPIQRAAEPMSNCTSTLAARCRFAVSENFPIFPQVKSLLFVWLNVLLLRFLLSRISLSHHNSAGLSYGS